MFKNSEITFFKKKQYFYIVFPLQLSISHMLTKFHEIRLNHLKVFIGGTKRTIETMSILSKLGFINKSFLMNWNIFVYYPHNKIWFAKHFEIKKAKNSNFEICQKTVKNNGFLTTVRFQKTNCHFIISFICW